MRTTLKDIASELGITTATVSRALNDHPEISSATKKKVKAIARRLNYLPNKLASSLRSGKSKIIGILVPSVEHLFFGAIIHGISNIASHYGYDVLIYQSNESEEFEKKGIDTFIAARVDGILVSVSKNTKNYSHFQDVKSKNIPMAFFDRSIESFDVSTVCIDDYKGGYIATKSLINSGYKNIAHICGPQHIKAFAERHRGFKDALIDSYYPYDSNRVFEGDITIQAGRNGFKHFWKQLSKPDAIIAVEDFTALGILKELKINDIKVPSEFGVMGFCNDLFGEHITPSLSTIDQKTIQMGEESFKLIYELIHQENPYSTYQKRILTPSLILRESSLKD